MNYQERYSRLVDQLQTETVKSESKDEERDVISTKNAQVQTEPTKVELSDLSNSDVMRLMSMMENIRNQQYPFWMPPYLSHAHVPSI